MFGDLESLRKVLGELQLESSALVSMMRDEDVDPTAVSHVAKAIRDKIQLCVDIA